MRVHFAGRLWEGRVLERRESFRGTVLTATDDRVTLIITQTPDSIEIEYKE